MILDPEEGPPPMRCDSSLSVIKIQSCGATKAGNFAVVSPKFSDPDIEELYQLHSKNRKRTELYRCFLYAVAFYCVAQIVVHCFWAAPLNEYPDEVLRRNQGRRWSTLSDGHVVHHHDTDGPQAVAVQHEHPGPGGMLSKFKSSDNEKPLNREFDTLSHSQLHSGSHRSDHEPHVQHFRNRTFKTHHPKSGFSGGTTHTTSQSFSAAPAVSSNQSQPDLHPLFSGGRTVVVGSNSGPGGAGDDDDHQEHEGFGEDHEHGTTSAMDHDHHQHHHQQHEVDSSSDEWNTMEKRKRRAFAHIGGVARAGGLMASSSHHRRLERQQQHSHRFDHRQDHNKQEHLTSTERRLFDDGPKVEASRINDNKRRTRKRRRSASDRENINGNYGYQHDEPSDYEETSDHHHHNHHHQQGHEEDLTEGLIDRRYVEYLKMRLTVFIVVGFLVLGLTLTIVTLMLLPLNFLNGNPHVPVILWALGILLPLVLRWGESIPARAGLGWVLLETFLIWVTLPINLYVASVYSIVLAMAHTAIVVVMGSDQEYIGRQLGANLILIVTTNLLGILSFYLSDKKQRRAFIDTRQSLEMKLVIEEQAREQERLLLSVLPEHLALKMRQDLGASMDSQFKKIYMSRHENVSILYADIVGFTAISSTYSASELVKILNELFARFDRLADKYHQIRIKILGDCYYCICGAPEERPDHAVLSVHMGLSMVKAIKYVRETTNSPVDMRVGIHTGAILAGVLGQRQWQFDIYSKDGELANKMESSGVAGRVHVSEKTLSFLNDEFEVELGHGEKREEILRIAGIKTYFIVKAKKPLQRPSTASVTENGECGGDEVGKDFPSELNSTCAEDSTSNVDDSPGAMNQWEQERYRQRLKKELTSRDGYRDLARQTKWFTLSFLDVGKEAEYLVHKEPYAGLTSMACPSALASVAFASFFVVGFSAASLLVALLGLLILLFISGVSACETSALKARLKKISNVLASVCSMESKLWVRRLLLVIAIVVLTGSNAVFMIPCFEAGSVCQNATLVAPEESYFEDDMEIGTPGPPLALPVLSFTKLGCLYPAYLMLFCAFFLLSVTLMSQPGSWLKSAAVLVVVGLHVTLFNFTTLKKSIDCSEKYSFNFGRGSELIPETCYLSVFALVVFLVLFNLNRRMEKSSRVLFLWRSEVDQQRERATQIRQKNEALVYNILPPHVATHFLGNRRRKHEELYSQSYSEVGILFASIPNYSDFYSEETVNNQGLECLRFLNEVISDFDALLELPKFQDHIIKIKTIGSTYMAASGLSPSKQTKAEDPLKVRWNHLSLLVEFAFELKRALTSINEQSFNHFVLKMGINHGPITAGVIGARKPHYDIWGNSVNVASRMESTGKAGCIQVTDETYKILLLYGYLFEQRGLVNVKGKGQLMTYYLTGRGAELTDEVLQRLLAEHAVAEQQAAAAAAAKAAAAAPVPATSSNLTTTESH